MFEKLMFWKKKEEPSFGSIGSSLENAFPGASQTDFTAAGQVAPGSLEMNSMPGMNPGMGQNLGLEHGGAAYPSGMALGQSMSGTDPFSNSMSTSPIGLGSNNPYAQQLQSPALTSRSVGADPNAIHPRDVELILSRLELIRSEIENVNHRLTFLEQSMRQPAGKGGKNWY